MRLNQRYSQCLSYLAGAICAEVFADHVALATANGLNVLPVTFVGWPEGGSLGCRQTNLLPDNLLATGLKQPPRCFKLRCLCRN